MTRLDTYKTNTLVCKAALLDPRFKAKAFLGNEELFAEIKGMLTNELMTLIKDKQTEELHTENEAAKPDDRSINDLIWEDFDRTVDTQVESIQFLCTKELDMFLQEPLLDRKQDPLKWWKTRAILYPNLNELAQKYLCITATSTPSERIFSKSGQLISERRNRLKGDNVNNLLFLHFNKTLI